MNYFVFDDIDTRDYSGIYVSFSNVDKTPKRVYDVVNIPARNGAFYIDKQRFEDVEHSYYVIALTKAIGSQFINDLASKVGYHRLEDSFNTDEFYSAVFTSGADIKITSQRDKNTFKVTFTRKPQRWLASGETAITVEDGDEIENPTKFDSEPLLAVDGYGTIGFNGYEVEIENVPIGDIVLYGGGSSSYITLDESNLNVGDTISVNVEYQKFSIKAQLASGHTKPSRRSDSITDSNSDFSTLFDSEHISSQVGTYFFKTQTPSFDIVVGTNSSITNTVSGTVTARPTGGDVTLTFSITQTFTYTASTHTLTYSDSRTISSSQTWCTAQIGIYNPRYNDIIGHSTKSAVTDTVYIDCDIGECYTYNSADELVSLNGVISLGSDLPKLASGTNTFTYDNTVTELKVQPRWWKV